MIVIVFDYCIFLKAHVLLTIKITDDTGLNYVCILPYLKITNLKIVFPSQRINFRKTKTTTTTT